MQASGLIRSQGFMAHRSCTLLANYARAGIRFLTVTTPASPAGVVLTAPPRFRTLAGSTHTRGSYPHPGHPFPNWLPLPRRGYPGGYFGMLTLLIPTTHLSNSDVLKSILAGVIIYSSQVSGRVLKYSLLDPYPLVF